MHKLLVDTCVWLDLAKDPEYEKTLDIVEELITINELSLIVPQIVIDEFSRNKERSIKESGKSLSGVIKRVKDAVNKFGDRETKQAVLEQLNNIDYKIPGLGESAAHAVTRIEKILNSSDIIEANEGVTADQLYVRIKAYIFRAFKNASTVLQVDNKSGGLFGAKGIIEV
ncbi:hypothetical protein GCM10028818_55010 [Spirosoma horti]